MKKIISVAFILALTACETGFDVNLTCVSWHTAQSVAVESSLLGEKDQVIVTLLWRWTYQKPQGDAVIVERSTGGSANYTVVDTVWNIDTLMSFVDSDSVLQPGGQVSYLLSMFNATAVNPFDTVDFELPAAQNFYQPQDTVLAADTTLQIIFAPVPGMDSTNIAIYEGGPTSIDSLLNFLTNPLFTITVADTVFVISNVDSLLPNKYTPYTIKLMSTKLSDLSTDASIGFRAFMRVDSL
jgi:hypothetical protein